MGIKRAFRDADFKNVTTMPEENDELFAANDEGTESTPTVNDEDVFASPSKVDSAEETTPQKSTDSEDESGEGEEVSKESEESTEPEAKSDDEISNDERQKIRDDAEKRIADGTAPKWFKNVVDNVYKVNEQKAKDALAVYEPLNDYGDVEKITGDLEIVKGLEFIETNPTTGLPERTVRPAVDLLVERKGFDTAFDVFLELGGRINPKTGIYLFDELMRARGLDPDHIDDYKTLKSNGYQMNGGNPPPDPADLKLIPENLREAYSSMTPAQRAKIEPFDDDSPEDIDFRERTLTAIQHQLDTERAKKANEQSEAEKAATAKLQEQQKFYQDVNVQTQTLFGEYGARMHTSFKESLVNAGLDGFDALSIANTMSVVLNNPGIEGKSSKEELEKIGVKLDPSIESLYSEWQETGYQSSVYKIQLDHSEAAKDGNASNIKADYDRSANRFNELTEKLERKAKPVIAGIIAHRGKQLKTRVESNNASVDDTQQFNNGTKPNEGQPHTVDNGKVTDKDFSEASYAQINPFR